MGFLVSARESFPLSRWLLLAGALVLVVLFAFTGSTPAGLALALALGGIVLLQFVSLLPGSLLLVGIPLLILTPNFSGWRIFDAVVPFLVIAAWVATIRMEDRGAYEIHTPGWLALAMVVAPMPGIMIAESVTSFLGSLKELVVYVLVFLSVRRLVTRRTSELLLWALPLLGIVGAVELLLKTRGVGGLLARSSFRNFYTDLLWGQSNAIAAFLLVCLCGTTLVAVLDRRLWVRLGLFAAAAVMLQAFLILSSRSATLALGVFVLVLVLGLGGWFRWVALGAGAAIAAAGLSLSSGRLLLSRFSDPAEYASVTERQHLWSSAWARFLESPWIGIGANQGKYFGDSMGAARAHNLLLDTLMEQGIVGAIVLVVVVIAVYRVCARVRPTGEPSADRRIRVVCFAFISAVLLQSMVEPTLLSVIVTMPFLWFLIWLIAQDQPEAQHSPA